MVGLGSLVYTVDMVYTVYTVIWLKLLTRVVWLTGLMGLIRLIWLKWHYAFFAVKKLSIGERLGQSSY